MVQNINYRNYLIEELKNDKEEAKEYLKAAIEEYSLDGNIEAFLLALHTVAKARGGVTNLAKESNLNRQSLYKVFNNKSKPQFETIRSVVDALGFKITLESKTNEATV